MAILLYLLLCLLPAAVFELIVRGLHRWSTYDDMSNPKPKRRFRLFGKRRAGGQLPVAKPISEQFVTPNCDRYRSDLRRLASTHDRLQTAEVPARALRLRAVEMAYDDILRDACAAFELDRPPEHLDSITRVQVEADLLTAGLRW